MLSIDRLGEALSEQTQAMATLADDGELGRQVPTCPDWDLRQLLTHVGQGHRFSADAVRRQVTAPDELLAPTHISAPDHGSELPAWLVDGAAELIDAVRSIGPEQPVWNFTGHHQQAGFWLRRMAHEAAVHRYDAALSVDQPPRVDPDLAADGISEWLAMVTAPGAAAARPEAATALRGQGQTLHLHATDSPNLGATGEWLIRRGPDAVTWQHDHQKADVAVRGLASDLLLTLLGRVALTDERIDVLGDVGLFEHWQRHVTF